MMARRGNKRAFGLMGGASAMILALALSGVANAQQREVDSEGNEVEEVVVTGTSLRAAPVGSSVVAVGQEAIQETAAQTVQQVLRSVPAVVGMGAVGQGAFGSADGAGTNAPTIHGLGASASNSTLILIDGHRFPLSGINHALADPNIIAPIALERVEVLADGASSVYGSDAVAGVINFITRRNFDGVEAQAQTSWADGYDAFSAGVVGGKTWEGGSALAAYSYSDRSNLSAGDRDFTRLDKRPLGGSNLGSFFCAPATVTPNGSSLIYVSPYTGAGVANSAVNAPCDYSAYADLIPSEERHSLMVKLSQDISDKLNISGDLVYSNRQNQQANSRGTIQSVVFGPGAANAAQINPFYVGVTGSSATQETVRFDANELFGPGAYTDAGEETYYVSASAEYWFNDNWRLNVGGVVGASDSFSQAFGALCSSCANLALNGTTNGSGSTTSVSVPGTSLIVLNSPLTTANALDVWRTGSANLTSAALRSSLTDSTVTQLAGQTIKDLTVKLDGELFTLPAGPLKVAVGAETIYYTMDQDITRPLGIGPASTGSSFTHLEYERNVKSAFAEFLIPIVSPEMSVPLVKEFDLNVSGRYDDYSDFGETTNPKVGLNWLVVDGFKVRANWAQSFVAPALTSRGNETGRTGETSVTLFGGTVNVPVSAYPSLIGMPGCPVGSVTCSLGGSVAGLQVNGGNSALQPQEGESWAVGFDWDPSFAPGLRLSATYWSNELQGAITAPQASFAVNSAGLNSLLTLYPTGATPTQIATATAGLPLQTSIPSTVYFIYNFQQRNALNLWVEGVDLSASYGFETSIGRITLDALASYKTKFDQQVGTGGAIFSVLNTTGFNTTFPSIELDSRVILGWDSKFGLSANLAWNHTGAYNNWSGTTVTPITRAGGVPVGGGDKVEAGDFFDLHLAYDFPGEGLTKELQVFADVNNLFDEDPPFYNATNGYDTFSGNPLGRVISVGARKRW